MPWPRRLRTRAESSNGHHHVTPEVDLPQGDEFQREQKRNARDRDGERALSLSVRACGPCVQRKREGERMSERQREGRRGLL